MVADNLQQALEFGLAKKDSSTASGKRKTTELDAGPSLSKKQCEWLGVDNLSDLSSSDDDTENPGQSASASRSDEVSNSRLEEVEPRIIESSHSSDEPAEEDSAESTKSLHLEDQSGESCEAHVQGNSSSTDNKLSDGDSERSSKGNVEINSITSGSLQPAAVLGNISDDSGVDDGTSLSYQLSNSAGDMTTDSQILTPAAEKLSDSQADVDLDQVESVEELEMLGLERLKVALMSRHLKCGGTLAERAKRLWSVRGLDPDQIDPTLFAKPTKKK